MADADDFVPPPPVVTKEAPKGQWDDEDQEEEAKEEAAKEVPVVPVVSMSDGPSRYLRLGSSPRPTVFFRNLPSELHS